MENKQNLPTYTQFIEAAFTALKSLKAPVTTEAASAQIRKNLKLKEPLLEIPHDSRTGMTEADYRIGCALSFLRSRGVAAKTKEGIWTITSLFSDREAIDVDEVEESYHLRYPDRFGGDSQGQLLAWEKNLYDILQNLSASRFVRMIVKFLAAEEFKDIVVIDFSDNGSCYGTALAHGDKTKRTAFCAKRFQEVTEIREIRELRGAFSNTIKRGIYITLGGFSEDARAEAKDPRKIPLELIDGMDLVRKMAEKGIGVSAFKDYRIDQDFFESLDS
ncbi:MAG: restriction endonuclease [Lachnospiraceae bacterium]|nr:restriction endonuclease [Lachnospiraceae bacterium]